MIQHYQTMRALLAIYLAFCLPLLCCCHLSAADPNCAATEGRGGAVPLIVDSYIHQDHHDVGTHPLGTQAHADDEFPYPVIPCDQNNSEDCDCNDSESDRSFLVEKSATIDQSILAVMVVSWNLPITTVRRPIIHPLAIGNIGPPMTLVLMHCALIV